MAKTFVLNCKLDVDDRERLVWLAKRVQRTKADTVRWLIREATGGPQPAARKEPFMFVAPEPLGIIGDWEDWGEGAPGWEDAQ